jgi:putative transposase
VARAPRQFVSGGIYHVWTRGSNRQPIFTFDSDRSDFLSCLERVVARTNVRCLAYCLMSNHYHLVLQTIDGELSRSMKALNGRYALRFNRRYRRDAHVFRNRFGVASQKSESQLLWTARYVVRNPVDAGLCGSPDQWLWSSYRASAGLDRAPPFLDVPRLHSYLSARPDRAVELYRAYVDDYVGV